MKNAPAENLIMLRKGSFANQNLRYAFFIIDSFFPWETFENEKN